MVVEEPYNLKRGFSTILEQRQSVVAFVDDTTWIASSKEQMERTIQIAEEFFRLNDIRINAKKSKLIICNTKKEKKERCIALGGKTVKEEGDSKVTRFLGIWLNCKLKESLVRAKAKEVIKATVQQLGKKRITLSQIAYINNMRILPKLCYILQAVKLSTKAIDQIQAPFLRLAKNKAGFQTTESGAVISHKDIGNCKQLKNELVSRQITELYHRLNEKGAVEVATEIYIKQGYLLAGLPKGSSLRSATQIFQKSGNTTWHV